jgi:hypothetical protein
VKQPERDDWDGNSLRFHDQEEPEKCKTPNKGANHPRAAPWKFIPAKTQTNKLQRNGDHQQKCTSEVHPGPCVSETPAQMEASFGVPDDQRTNKERKDGDRNLEEEAPPPADAVCDGSAKGGATDGAKTKHAVLQRLVHAPFPEGNHVRVYDCGCSHRQYLSSSY